MNAPRSEKAFTKNFKLSARLAVDMTVGLAGFVVEWDPAPPLQLSPKELRRYLLARDEMMKQLADMVGGTVLVVGGPR